MASSSSQRRRSTSEDLLMRQRVKDLEEEVASLKKRLEDLRKAKNTTVLKREREILEVGAPKLGTERDPEKVDSRVAELQQRLADSDTQKHLQLEALRKTHQTEMEELRKQQQQSKVVKPSGSNEGQQIVHHDTLEVVLAENEDLHRQIDQLLTELSEKEAMWCEKEDALHRQMAVEMNTRYAEWTSNMDHRREDLQQTNPMLTNRAQEDLRQAIMMKNEEPPGPDPSGQGGSGQGGSDS